MATFSMINTTAQSTGLTLFPWTWKWFQCTLMSSSVTRSKSNKASIGCGSTAHESAAITWCNHMKSMPQRTAALRAKFSMWFQLTHDLNARLLLSDPIVVAFSFIHFKIYWAVALMKHSGEWNMTPSLDSENRAESNGRCGCWCCL